MDDSSPTTVSDSGKAASDPLGGDTTALYGGNAAFLEELYEAYLADPSTLDPQWQSYFEELAAGARDVPHGPVRESFLRLAQQPLRARAALPQGGASAPQQSAEALITAYRVYGDIAAKTNPLNLRRRPHIPELTPEYYGLSEDDLGAQVQDGPFSGPLRDVVAALKDTYCGSIGFEFSYLPAAERQWFQEQIEAGRGRGQFAAKDKKRLYSKLNMAEGLERYLHIRYVGQKRFSLEGSDSFIPLLDEIILQAGTAGVKEVVIGMAHRGRLNVLVNIMGKKTADLFDEFEGKKALPDPEMSGDVKYHMGISSDIATPGGPVHLALAFNPSHLELVSPVVHGSARARQDRRGDQARQSVLPITVHGDAAVIGQGVVMETLNLSRLRGFTTGGAVRIVINNQVGFTISDPRDTRSSRYCTDVAKIANAPVMHVNGDDLEAVAFCGQLALAYRQKFGKDVFIDLISYRKHGHNEGDDPTMTQPIMYRQIKAHPGSRQIYAEQLIKEGVLSEEDVRAAQDEYVAALDRGESVVQEVPNPEQDKYTAHWADYRDTAQAQEAEETGVPLDTLRRLGERISALPEGFSPHRGVARVMQARQKMSRGEQPLDWGMGEMLAYASLLHESYGVRLVGQDSGRGTFVHRHAVLHDQKTEDPFDKEYLTLQAALPEGEAAQVEVIDSTLSEEAVMAFEYGYSTSEPRSLVAWEAQFGDFANGAQAVIDQFLAAGEAKWNRYSGLTLLLPHGYEGAGPEHSSARLERYLQLCAQRNMQVVVPSSPAQMFHLLRRQVLRSLRKPLIVMTPKSLLRHKLAVSSLEELSSGQFQEVIGDPEVSEAGRVVVCSGKLYWELFEAREKEAAERAEAGEASRGKGSPDKSSEAVALIRLEQLYPFPAQALAAELQKHPKATVVWAQEEPQNQGAWLMIRDDLEAALAQGQRLRYVARPRAASTATGLAHLHAEEQAKVIAAALADPVDEEVLEAQVELTEEAEAQG